MGRYFSMQNLKKIKRRELWENQYSSWSKITDLQNGLYNGHLDLDLWMTFDLEVKNYIFIINT